MPAAPRSQDWLAHLARLTAALESLRADVAALRERIDQAGQGLVIQHVEHLSLGGSSSTPVPTQPPPVPTPLPASVSAHPNRPRLTPAENRVLAVLGREPQTAAAIARRLGKRRPTSWLYAALRGIQAKLPGQVLHEAGTYRLAAAAAVG